MPQNWFTIIDIWHWWALGAILIILELLSPGIFLLWVGLAAAMVGVLLLIVPDLSWNGQLLAFAIYSISLIFFQHIWLKRNPIITDHPTLNRRGQQYVGRVFTLDIPIINGEAKIQVDDSTWKIRGADCVAGTKIIVTDVDSTILLVQPHANANLIVKTTEDNC